MAHQFKCPACDDSVLVLDEDKNIHVCGECELEITVEEADEKFENGELVMVESDDNDTDDLNEEAEEEFNGFSNRQTWATNLLIQNNYKLFREARETIGEDDEKTIAALKSLVESNDKLKNIDPEAINFSELVEELKEAGEELKDITEDLNSALAVNEELTDEQKAEISQVFESALQVATNRMRLRVEEETAERFDAELENAVHDLNEKADQYLTHVAEEWFEENRIAIESGIKVEKTERFLEGLHQLFEQNYIEVPEERFDVLADMAQKIEDLEEQVETEKAATAAAKAELVNEHKKDIVESLCEGYADTDVERIKELAESIDYESDEQFESQLKKLRESLIDSKNSKKGKTTLAEDTSGDDNTDDDADNKPAPSADPLIAAAAGMLRKQ